MPNFSDIVFGLTPQGQAALDNHTTPLAAPLKAVLTMIDGVCPVAQYIPFLRAFKPLDEKFHILESMGYLRRVGTVSSEVVTRFEKSITMGLPVASLRRIDAEVTDSGFAAL
jgi:hypothetical protein